MKNNQYSEKLKEIGSLSLIFSVISQKCNGTHEKNHNFRRAVQI